MEDVSPRAGCQALFYVFKDVDLRIEKSTFSNVLLPHVGDL